MHNRWLCRTPQYSSQTTLTTLAFCSTVSWPWPTTYLHSAGPASFNSVSSGRSNSHWRWRRRRHLFMHLSAADSAASDPECCRSSCHRCSEVYERMTSVLRSLHWLPVRQRCVQVSPRTSAAVPDRVVQTDIIWCWASSSSFCIHSSADRSTYENKLRRPQLFCSSMWNSLPNDLRLSDMSLETLALGWKPFSLDTDYSTSHLLLCANLGYINSIIIFFFKLEKKLQKVRYV